MPSSLQDATKAWVTFVQDYYANTPNRGELTQVFARGYFSGWSEREVAMLADQLAANAAAFPPWIDKT